jgi:hypothetical protein
MRNRIVEKSFASVLRAEDKELFMEMIEGCNKYTDSITARRKPFTTESPFVTLILEQQKMIKLVAQIPLNSKSLGNREQQKPYSTLHTSVMQ